MSTETTARQPKGVPVGGQFTTTARAEADTTLAADPTQALGFVPEDLTGLDDADLAVLRRGVQDKFDRARLVLDGADLDRRVASDWGDRDEIVKVSAAEKEAEQDLESGLADLTRITDAQTAGKMSRDDMTPAQLDLVDGVHRHAYEYADAHVGGMVLPAQDDAEEFAAYVVQYLIRNEFDESSLSNAHLLRDFDRERAGRLAAKLTDDPTEKAWATRMASDGGLSTVQAAGMRRDRHAAGALSSFAHTLTQAGFYVERYVSGGKAGVTFKLTGGGPVQTPDAA